MTELLFLLKWLVITIVIGLPSTIFIALCLWVLGFGAGSFVKGFHFGKSE